MGQFTIVNSQDEVPVSKNWKDADKFHSRGKVIEFKGRRYEMIAKKHSKSELLKRRFLGVLTVIATFGFGLLSTKIKKLFHDKNHRFGIEFHPSEAHNGRDARYLIINSVCHKTTPCQHDFIITYYDGTQERKGDSSPGIYEIIRSIPRENFTANGFGVDHFAQGHREEEILQRYAASE